MRPVSPLRIARVLTRLNLGGPARQVLASDPLLVERGHRVRIFAGRPEAGEGDLFAEAERRGLEVVRVPGLKRGLAPGGDWRAGRALRKALCAEPPDVLHTHASKAGTLGRFAVRGLTQTACVHTFHGHVLEGYFPAPISRRMIAHERRLARRTDRVLAVSHAVFCGPAVQRLDECPADKILATDTIPRRGVSPKNLEVVSTANLLAKAIENIHRSESVSSLFEEPS